MSKNTENVQPAPLFPLATELELAAYASSLEQHVKEDFADSTGEGLPETELPSDERVYLPVLIILSSLSSTGLQLRTEEEHRMYTAKVERNLELARAGRYSEMDVSGWEDPEYSLQELQAELIVLKNRQLLQTGLDTACCVKVFLEMEYIKAMLIPFLLMLKRLGIAYQQVYS